MEQHICFLYAVRTLDYNRPLPELLLISNTFLHTSLSVQYICSIFRHRNVCGILNQKPTLYIKVKLFISYIFYCLLIFDVLDFSFLNSFFYLQWMEDTSFPVNPHLTALSKTKEWTHENTRRKTVTHNQHMFYIYTQFLWDTYTQIHTHSHNT